MSEIVPLFRRGGLLVGQALVDAEDIERVLALGTWGLHSKGYAVSWVDGRNVLLHRFLMGLEAGNRVQVDHIDRNPLNCVRSNMRRATFGQNRQNQPARGGSSKHRGVSWDKTCDRWRARAKLDGRNQDIGWFCSELEAAEAAARWRTEHMPYSVEVAR